MHEAPSETFASFPLTAARLGAFVRSALAELSPLSAAELVADRYRRFRALGTFETADAARRAELIQQATAAAGGAAARAPRESKREASLISKYLAEQTVRGEYSRYRGLAPAAAPLEPPAMPAEALRLSVYDGETAKRVLDRDGPEAMARWVRARKEVRRSAACRRTHGSCHAPAWLGSPPGPGRLRVGRVCLAACANEAHPRHRHTCRRSWREAAGGALHAAGCAWVARPSPVPVQMWKGRAESRCRCGRVGAADVTGAHHRHHAS